MIIEDLMQSVPLLSEDYYNENEDYINEKEIDNDHYINEKEIDNDHYIENADKIEDTETKAYKKSYPLEVDKDYDNPYGLLPDDYFKDNKMSFKDRMICLFTVFSFCFPINLVFLIIYRYG